MASRRLYNWQFAQVKGKEMRLEAELIAHKGGAPVPRNAPLFSHDATLQSYFDKAWRNVHISAIKRHVFENTRGR
ncbi:hypothetical protein OH458_00205 [Vibrio sp. MarTm2]|uniref:hypothetical protein n=1 Tax=Vibrio sp. MarTm2 TaxID=2998831 RepID=UPI0022CD32A0|nr:hypothetical protein [Vibrio sp. MarTm2]MDA0126498.1 hypothetical protein [Vibrio sp. MarTm2]